MKERYVHDKIQAIWRTESEKRYEMAFGDRLVRKKGVLVHDSGLCNYCGLCGRRFPHRAFKVNTEQKSWKIRGICMRCGRCIRECPKKALSLQTPRLSTGAVSPERLSPEEVQKIQEKIVSRVQHYCRIMGVSVGRITIRNQKSRWGSCSSKGNLNFNYQLYYLPDELLDYVVINELAHRTHMNHSKEFWAEVEKYCPDYRQRRERLSTYALTEKSLTEKQGG